MLLPEAGSFCFLGLFFEVVGWDWLINISRRSLPSIYLHQLVGEHPLFCFALQQPSPTPLGHAPLQVVLLCVFVHCCATLVDHVCRFTAAHRLTLAMSCTWPFFCCSRWGSVWPVVELNPRALSPTPPNRLSLFTHIKSFISTHLRAAAQDTQVHILCSKSCRFTHVHACMHSLRHTQTHT